MGKIKWSEKAGKNLQAIYDYIAKDSHIYAIRFIKSLIKATDKLEQMPHCGRIVPELEEYGFREVIYQNYRIRLTGPLRLKPVGSRQKAVGNKKSY